MTLTIELSPELERRLREQAEREGLDTGGYVERLVESHLTRESPRNASLWDTLSPEEWDRVTQEWIDSHDPAIPPLPDRAVSRESFYEERDNAVLGRHEHTPEMGSEAGTSTPARQSGAPRDTKQP